MKQVISASRRTDIPAFYLPWLMDKIRHQKVSVPNPFNRKQIREVSLAPVDVAWIVFWSRNYHIFLQNYEFFNPYHLFFHFTINPPHDILEPDMLPPENAFRQLEILVKLFGSEVIIWRYDPLVFYKQDQQTESNHHIRLFEHYLKRASGLGLSRCYISIVFLYPKVIRRALQQKNFSFISLQSEIRNQILREMVEKATHHGIQLYSCANNDLLEIPGINMGRCIDGPLLNQLGPHHVSEKSQSTRPDCGCTESVDIGDYVSTACKYHCLYCYARK